MLSEMGAARPTGEAWGLRECLGGRSRSLQPISRSARPTGSAIHRRLELVTDGPAYCFSPEHHNRYLHRLAGRLIGTTRPLRRTLSLTRASSIILGRVREIPAGLLDDAGLRRTLAPTCDRFAAKG